MSASSEPWLDRWWPLLVILYGVLFVTATSVSFSPDHLKKSCPKLGPIRFILTFANHLRLKTSCPCIPVSPLRTKMRGSHRGAAPRNERTSIRSSEHRSPCSVLFSAAARAQQPDSASFMIQFPQPVTRFHVGEVIPIELLFSSSIPNTFSMSTRSYDRSGRLDEEKFHVTPEGRDPLHNYYDFGMVMGGGLGGFLILDQRA